MLLDDKSSQKRNSYTISAVNWLKNYFFVSALCVVFAASCSGNKYGSLGAPDEKVPLMEDIRTGTLTNGLTYFILENAKPENRAYITLAVKTGSVMEDDDEQGLAHFVEHMAFNSTEHFPGTEVVEYLRSLGMRFGAHVNAYTSFDQTVYGIEVPVKKDSTGMKVLPERALEIIDDWTHAVLFEKKEVDAERPIIIEEYRARLGAGERASRELLSLLFEGSKYADRRPIGKLEIIENAPAERLENFYHKWYRADNMALIFVGDFDGTALEANLASAFTINAPDTPLPASRFELPPPQKGKTEVRVFTDPELTTTVLSLYYKLPWTPNGSALRDFRTGLIDNLINKIVSERWTDTEYQIETPYFSAYSFKERMVKSSLHYVTGAAVKTGRTKEALAAILRANETIVRYGFLESEIERAKTSLLSDLEKILAEIEKTESQRYINLLENYFVSGETLPGIKWEYTVAKELLPGISAKELHEAVKRYFTSEDVLVFIRANTSASEELPSSEEVAEMVRLSKKAAIERPKDVKHSSEFLDTVPNGGEITEESFDEETETVIWKLNNGAKVLLKPTDNQNDEIVMQAMAIGGWTSAPLSELVSAKLAGELVSASGLGKWKVPELSKKLAGKQVMISFGDSSFTRNIEGVSTKADLRLFFELLYLGFTEPRIDEDTAIILKDEYRTMLAQHNDSPSNVFNDEVTKIIYNNNPYFKPMEIADLDKIDLDAARSWTERCRNAADYTFSFVGNIDIDSMRDLVTTYLASIPAKTPFNRWTDPHVEFPQNVDQAVYKGKEEKSIVYLGRMLYKDWSLQRSLTSELLEEYLDIALIQQIREKLGGVYSISASLGVSPTPPPGEHSQFIYFVCAPARVNELTVAVEAELNKIAAGVINMDTFEKARSALIKSWENAMESNSYISGRFTSYSAFFGLPLGYLYKRPEFYETITPKDIQDMQKTYLTRALVRIVLYPEAEKTP